MTQTTATVQEIQESNAQQRGRVIAAALSAFGPDTAQDTLHRDRMASAIEAALFELAACLIETGAEATTAKRRGHVALAKELNQVAARIRGFAVGLTTPGRIIMPTTTPPPVTGAFVVNGGVAEAVTAGDATQIIANALTEAVQPTLCAHPGEQRSTLANGDTLCTGCQTRWPAAPALTGNEPIGTEVTVGGTTFTKIGNDPFPEAPTGDAVMDFLTGKTNVYNPTTEQENVQAMIAHVPSPTTNNPFSDWLATNVHAEAEALFASPSGPAPRRAVQRVGWDALPTLAAALPPRDAASHSFVETMEMCGLKMLLERSSRHGNLGAFRPSFSLIGGIAFHKVIEVLERQVIETEGRNLEIVNVEQAWSAALNLAVAEAEEAVKGSAYADHSTWHASNGGKEGFDWWRVEGGDMVRRYIAHHDAAWRATHGLFRGLSRPELGDPAAPPVIGGLEAEFLLTVPSPFSTSAELAIPSRGFIDQVWIVLHPEVPANVVGHRTLEIHDLKTGSRVPKSTFQLGEYAHGLVQMFPGLADATITGSFWLARKGQFTPPRSLREAHPMAELSYRYAAANDSARAGIYPPKVSDLCSACGAVDYCPTQG